MQWELQLGVHLVQVSFNPMPLHSRDHNHSHGHDQHTNTTLRMVAK